VTGLVRADLPSESVVMPVTGLVRAPAPLSHWIVAVERLVRQVCASAAAGIASDAQASNAMVATLIPRAPRRAA
jgi:hypothetical protein